MCWWDYWSRDPLRLRRDQNHDLEHILTGAGIDGLGELVPSWFRLTNVPKFIRNQELAGELVIVHLIFALRYMVRTLLHYPQVWFHAADAIQRGMLAGRASDALFLKKMEPVLGMPLTEARAALGLREVVDRDTSQASVTGQAEHPRRRAFADKSAAEAPLDRAAVQGADVVRKAAEMIDVESEFESAPDAVCGGQTQGRPASFVSRVDAFVQPDGGILRSPKKAS